MGHTLAICIYHLNRASFALLVVPRRLFFCVPSSECSQNRLRTRWTVPIQDELVQPCRFCFLILVGKTECACAIRLCCTITRDSSFRFVRYTSIMNVIVRGWGADLASYTCKLYIILFSSHSISASLTLFLSCIPCLYVANFGIHGPRWRHQNFSRWRASRRKLAFDKCGYFTFD